VSDPQPGPIVRAAIHPAIGIARVGNSREQYFLAPEVADPLPAPPGFYKERDDQGALKRQAQLFRVYGYDAQGRVVRELTADDAEITWTAHVANTKAAWYEFQIALDIPEAATAQPSLLRNATVADRAQLAIDPGARTIAGRGQQGPQYHFDSGTFYGKSVYLGELRTDRAGRLLFLGGRGESASYDHKAAVTFANNDGWHDDVSDGPVDARVVLDGEEIPVEGAWVITGPPNYAPDVISVRTIHDLLYDVYVQNGWMSLPEQVSFTEHVYPVLQRMSTLEWVNRGFAVQFGWGGPNYFLEPGLLERLSARPANPALPDLNAELRRQIFNSFRNPESPGVSPLPWPWIYGDAMGEAGSERQYTTLTRTQHGFLRKWADGDFVNDWDPGRFIPRTLDEVPLQERPATLDRAALHFCLADAFHPGCEMTWPVRHATMYTAPFRVARRAGPEPSYGPVLTPEIALSEGGPLYGQAPGDISRWMAVPWQTDTASCRAGYEAAYDPYIPTFWPARVPNQVLTREAYEVVTNPAVPLPERKAAFSTRAGWLRVLSSNYKLAINEMVRDFGKLGVVEARGAEGAGPGFPAVMMVESKPAVPARQILFPKALLRTDLAPAAGAFAAAVDAVAEAVPALASVSDAAHARRLAEAGWDSDEDLAAAVAELHR
jgi:L-Lysine epsilon oxidase N-terminal/L-lysine epsilon oxidase C-terminal domain